MARKRGQALKKIVKIAKRLKRQGKCRNWRECIRKASEIYKKEK